MKTSTLLKGTALILTAAFFAACAPLHIVMDSKDDKGSRTVLTSNLDLMNFRDGTMSIALGATVRVKDTLAAVLITCNADSDHGIFSKDDRFMMRFEDGSELTLKNVYSHEYETSTETGTTHEAVNTWGYDYVYSPYSDGFYVTPYMATTMIPRTYVRKTTNSYALYLVTRAQIEMMMSKKCVKMRIETEDKEANVPDPSNFAACMKDLYDCLFERVVKGVRRTDF